VVLHRLFADRIQGVNAELHRFEFGPLLLLEDTRHGGQEWRKHSLGKTRAGTAAQVLAQGECQIHRHCGVPVTRPDHRKYVAVDVFVAFGLRGFLGNQLTRAISAVTGGMRVLRGRFLVGY